MKKILNQKAFTMVELLAAIVILGILSTIGLATVSKIIEQSKTNYYKTTKNTMLQAAQSYIEENKSLQPKNIGEVKTYTLQDLYDAKVITEKLTDDKGESCYPNKSKFYVYKASATDYKYTVDLKCPSCSDDGSCDSEIKQDKPEVTISYTECDGGKNEIKPQATINLSGNGAPIASYSYKIIKNKKTVYSSEAIRTKSQNTLDFTIDLEKYVPGPLSIKVTVTNEDGVTTSKTLEAPFEEADDGTSKAYCSDYVTVNCGNYSYETVANTYVALADNQKTCADTDWLNASSGNNGRKVWVTCDPLKGTPCKEPVYSGTFTKDSTSKNITISDTAGNENSCEVSTCIDKTYPSIKAEIYVSDASGNPTGKAKYTYDISGTKTNNTKNTDVTGWFNKSSAPYGVVIVVTSSDKTSNMKTLVYQTKAAGKNENDENASSYGSAQEISTKSQNITLTTDGYQKYKFTGTDHAGNTSVLEFAIKLDRTAPTYTLNYKRADSATYNSEWYNNNVTASANVSDYVSGIASQTYYKETNSVNTKSSNYYTSSDSSSNTYSNEGTYNAKFKVCDIAGNCSTSANKSISIDITKPTCTLSVDAGNVANQAYISVYGSDSLSGVEKYCYTTSNDPNTCYWENSIYRALRDISSEANPLSLTFYGFTKDRAGNINNYSNTSNSITSGSRYTICSQKTKTSSTYGNCSAACGAGTQSVTNHYVDKNFRNTCPNETASQSCTGTNCSKTLYVCRAGNTCIYDDSGYYCPLVAPGGTALEVKDNGDSWWYIVSGTFKGDRIKKGCVNESGSCDYSDCPG